MRSNNEMRRVAAIVLALLFSSLAPALADIVGRAAVIDGDTLEIHGQRIRLFGIDAPESAQSCTADNKAWRCGQQAALALDRKIAGHTVSCTEKDRDQYRRIVAVCTAGDEDLNAWLVAEGWALAYRQYSTTYIGQEDAARAAHKGVWRGTFVPSWDWRHDQRAETAAGKSQAPPKPEQTGNCVIKGNISTKGERIYHVPGGKSYEQTRIDTANGERWFCTEAEAQAAGWRRSRQ